MLTIKVEADAGIDLKFAFVEMGELANRTNVRIEMDANGVTFGAFPGDTPGALKAAFDRNYRKALKESEKDPSGHRPYVSTLR